MKTIYKMREQFMDTTLSKVSIMRTHARALFLMKVKQREL